MRPRAYLQIEVRRANLQVLEELFGHRLVVVLTGMDESRHELRSPRHGSNQRGDLHKVWSSADDIDDTHQARAPTHDSDREDMSNRREFDVTEEPRELLLFPRHADVVPDTMAPRHRLARLARI